MSLERGSGLGLFLAVRAGAVAKWQLRSGRGGATRTARAASAGHDRRSGPSREGGPGVRASPSDFSVPGARH